MHAGLERRLRAKSIMPGCAGTWAWRAVSVSASPARHALQTRTARNVDLTFRAVIVGSRRIEAPY
jgi:hypothetical protein